MTVMVMITLVILGNWGSALAGPVLPVPVPTPPPGGGGGRMFTNGSASSGYDSSHGWGNVSGNDLIVEGISGSIYFNPDDNPNDNVIASFSAMIDVNGSFAENPDQFPNDTKGPSVNGHSEIYEFSFVDTDPWDYIIGEPVFSLGYHANTNYWVNHWGQKASLWTNVYSNFDVFGGEITNSSASFSQNYWSPLSPPPPDWFMLSDWNGSLSVSGVVTSVVPEPATLSLLGAGAVATLIRRRREPKRAPSVIS